MLQIKILPAIVENQNFLIDDCVGFSFTNRGNTQVVFDDDLTIDPGQTWSISSSNDNCKSDCKICQTFNIKFVGIDRNRLEIVLLKSNDE